jgi:hypothetical protein
LHAPLEQLFIGHTMGVSHWPLVPHTLDAMAPATTTHVD